ncbi:zinc-finger domain-containing protein [Brevundimonas aveniformis]|uniref:zinc-finger domain-containing protein n=1 Tax=Brevundimonas aveniformis TaxID=370977 RepID=UPI00042345A2|nr:zinc-finger domain-containing protein [Brevundimonas aveniformis]
MPPRHSPTYSPKPEEIKVTTARVSCDGGGGALGHPLVYFDVGDDGTVECGYCDRRFVYGKKGSGYHDPAPRPEGDH